MAALTLVELLMKVNIGREKLDARVSDDHLLPIALSLTSWRRVAPHLGLSRNELDAIEKEGKNERFMGVMALQKWKSKSGLKATYKKLVEVLLSVGMADVAEKVCHLLEGIHPTHPVVCVCMCKLFSVC